MKKIGKYFLLIFVLLFIIKVLLSLFFNFIYYPDHPTPHTTLETFQGFAGFGIETESDKKLVPVPGGCFKTCSGKDIEVRCVTDNYGRLCEYKCYGYLYDTCQGIMSLIKYNIVK